MVTLPSVTEKDYLDIQLYVTPPGGHSSIPPKHTVWVREFSSRSPMLSKVLRNSIYELTKSDKALRHVETHVLEDGTFREFIGTTTAVGVIRGGRESVSPVV